MDSTVAFGSEEIEAMASEARDAIDVHLERRSDGVSKAEFWAIVAKAYTCESEFDGPNRGE